MTLWQQMAPFHPVYVTRSDGKLKIESDNETNAPTDHQLDDTPDRRGVTDFYKPLDSTAIKEIDWRRKLGGMLVRELGDKSHAGKNYILAALPDHFRLYEHLRYKLRPYPAWASEGRGPPERHDAYLYGHPYGRKKRYRSPAAFFPHLLWLATDVSGDRRNCGCKICSPDVDLPGQTEPTGSSSTNTDQAASGSSEANPSTTAKLPAPVAGPAVKRSTSQESGRLASSAAPSPTTTRGAATTIRPDLVPTPLPMPTSREQELDATYGRYLFRLGELVWFNRGPAWGLAIIAMRESQPAPGGPNSVRYLIQPLSHPFHHPPSKIVDSESDLRPWLAWSAPSPTHAYLGTASLSYDSIDWGAIVQGRYGLGDSEVDGSIFAAKAVDESYTPFDQISVGDGETRWKGIFLGGEKIWIGEAVRLRIGSGSDIMVVQHIVEKTRAGVAQAAPVTVVQLVGDIYTYATTTAGQQPTNNDQLPHRLRMDLEYREQAVAQAKGRGSTASYWKLMQPLARLRLGEIKGRWYESGLLLPLLRGLPDFQADVQRGEIGDAGAWMNGRCDASFTLNKVGVYKATRREAIGRAIPPDTLLSRGLDGPDGENVFPHDFAVGLDASALALDPGPADAGALALRDGDLDVFMDLEHFGHET